MLTRRFKVLPNWDLLFQRLPVPIIHPLPAPIPNPPPPPHYDDLYNRLREVNHRIQGLNNQQRLDVGAGPMRRLEEQLNRQRDAEAEIRRNELVNMRRLAEHRELIGERLDRMNI
jgi:hypothetical protein